MKTRVALLTVVTALALPAAAAAKTYSLAGKFEDPAATISLKVKVNKKGKPVSVSKVAAKNIRFRCPAPVPGLGDIEGRRDSTAPGTLTVSYLKRTKQYIFRKTFALPGGGNAKVFGVVSKNGKQVSSGDFSLNFKQQNIGCANAIGTWTAKKK